MPIIVVRNWKSEVARQFGNEMIQWRLRGEDLSQAVMLDQIHMRKLMLAIQSAAVQAGLHGINSQEQVTVSFDQGRILAETPKTTDEQTPMGLVVLEVNGLFATEDRKDTEIFKFLVRVAHAVREVSANDDVEALLCPFPVPFHRSSARPMYYRTGLGTNYGIWHKGKCLGAKISYQETLELLEECKRTAVPSNGHACVSKNGSPRIEYIELPEFSAGIA